MTPSADASAAILAQRIRTQLPTLFIRFGDGAVECILGNHDPKTPHTCDGEMYTPELGDAIDDTITALHCSHHKETVMMGDWRTAESPGSKPRHIKDWETLIVPERWALLHFETLLLMRISTTLLDFYQTVRFDRRRKLFIGPASNHGAARMLAADHLIVPDRDLFANVGWIKSKLDEIDPQVVLYGAGMAGNIPVVQHWAEHPDRTYIALGSALDPLFRGRSRSNQIRKDQAEKLFKEIL